LCIANPICFILFLQVDRRAASRACCTAGNNSAMSTAMMAITTNSSINVKPRLARPAHFVLFCITMPFNEENEI
jgi:hypothetical protein